MRYGFVCFVLLGRRGMVVCCLCHRLMQWAILKRKRRLWTANGSLRNLSLCGITSSRTTVILLDTPAREPMLSFFCCKACCLSPPRASKYRRHRSVPESCMYLSCPQTCNFSVRTILRSTLDLYAANRCLVAPTWTACGF
ncbi:hypothetical protein PMIN01_08938 [Paraphaeosphaeria minitans]|uniref:Uncharacterized protein n=1 Tax=Paraphaeosphaeria minitans TaxID=565426 RepID=A0A9P6KNR9_9PLEO|nr:hypothetical protein PMIN01_08938 [Paraphaeosphaeria minitans]